MRQRKEIQEVLRRRNYKSLVVTGIILFWLVMSGLLLRREIFVSHIDSWNDARNASRRPTNTWMGIDTADGNRVGFVNLRNAPGLRRGIPGVSTFLNAKLALTFLGQPSEILIVGSAWVPDDPGKAEFEFRVQSGEHDLRVEATIGEGRLDGKVHTAGEVIPLQLPVKDDLMLWGSMGAMLDVPRLEPGKVYEAETFDPITLSMGRARVECQGDEVVHAAGEDIPTSIVTISSGGLSSKAWVDESGEVIRMETPFGIVLEKIRPAEATLAATGLPAGDTIALTAVYPTGRSVFRGAKRMTIRLSGTTPADAVPTDDTQRTTSPGVYTITAPPSPAPGTEVPPLEQELEAEPLVQVEHPRIQHRALEIVGDEADPWKRATLVYQWVYENIEKAPLLSMPSALDVLETREGDCNEHTVLFTALARAAGIPTRIVLGLVWSDEYGAFGYHAWPEVYAGRWIWMDPTLGQRIADATHVKLVTGGIRDWPKLAAYLGQLQLEVLEIE